MFDTNFPIVRHVRPDPVPDAAASEGVAAESAVSAVSAESAGIDRSYWQSNRCDDADEEAIDRIVDQRFTPTVGTLKEMLRKDLTEKQLQAVELMAAGMNDSAVARSVGVHRVTVSRWRQFHPPFVAELNRRRQVDLQAASDRVRRLAQRAVDIIEERLSQTEPSELRVRAAMGLLRLLGVGRLACEIGATSADDFIDDRVYAKRRKDRWATIDHEERKSIVVDLARSADGAVVETPANPSPETPDGFQLPNPTEIPQ